MPAPSRRQFPELGPLVVQLTVSDAAAAVRYYAAVFKADELYRNTEADGGRITHCELLVGGSRIVVLDAFPELGLVSPVSLSGTSVSLNLYLDDVDTVFARAIEAGGRAISLPQERFWGARSGSLLDPFGHRWVITTQLDDLSPDEIIARSQGTPLHARLSGVAPK